MTEFPMRLDTSEEDTGQRLDRFLAVRLPRYSRAQVQQLIEKGEVQVNETVAKASLRLRGGERIVVARPPQAQPLRAMAEEIPLDLVYEDDDLAIVNKPAGMMVHAGAGATEEARNRGTLVNALLHRFQALSGVGGEMRPGIVHRLDRSTSGLMVVAKNDESHRKLAQQFSDREVHKTYIALVHGWPKDDQGTIRSAISRDVQRRIRMTTRRSGGREAVSHYVVKQKLDTPYGKFALLQVKIETGRTHQIRVHLSSLGYPVVGDSLYGAPKEIRALVGKRRLPGASSTIALPRNFLHSAQLELVHPRSGEALMFSAPLPAELSSFLADLERSVADDSAGMPG